MKLKNLKKTPFEIAEKLIITDKVEKLQARDNILKLLFITNNNINITPKASIFFSFNTTVQINKIAQIIFTPINSLLFIIFPP